MKIYQHKQNTPSSDFASLFKIAFVATALICLSVVAKADPAPYECDLTSTGTCIIYLDKVLEEQDTLADALAYCEFYDGVFDPETDTCTLDLGVHHE